MNNQTYALGNIGVLDLRNTSREAAQSISKIGNVGMVLFSPETSDIVASLPIGNAGGVAQASASAKFLNGGLTLTGESTEMSDGLTSLVVNGSVMIARSMTAEQLDATIESLVVNGDVVYPNHLEDMVLSRTEWANGQLIPFSEGEVVVSGRLLLTEGYLRSLEDGTSLVVTGPMRTSAVLDNDLLERKLSSLKPTRGAVIREENVEAFMAVATWSSEPRIVPAGFEVVSRPITLDDATLRSLRHSKLYVDSNVIVAQGTDASLLEDRVQEIVCRGRLICPTSLVDVLGQKCDLIQTMTVFYEGQLFMVEEEIELSASWFEYTESPVTLVVMDELYIAPDVEPSTLASRIDKVHNLDDIYCSPEQAGALQARLGINEGEFFDYAKKNEFQGSNYGYRAL